MPYPKREAVTLLEKVTAMYEYRSRVVKTPTFSREARNSVSFFMETPM